MVYRVENGKIDCKEIKKFENVQTGTKRGLKCAKWDVIYVKRGQNWLKQW